MLPSSTHSSVSSDVANALHQPLLPSSQPLADPVATAVSLAGASRIHEVVFVDATLADYETLVEGARSHTAVYLIDPNSDELSQISQVLAGYSNLTAVHILSHGSDGTLQLGNTQLGANNLVDYAGVLQSWGASLSEFGDIVLYGCDLAATATGQAFVQQMAALTGADVAASTDLTGHGTLGGDWELEFSTGTIDATGWSQAQIDYQHVLAMLTVTNTADSGAGSLRQAIIAANATPGEADTITFAGSIFADPFPDLITLTSSLIIDSNITIQGTGANNLAIVGASGANVFTIAPTGVVALDGLTIRGGSTGIFNQGTISDLSNSVISNNASNGIYNSGAIASLSNSTINANGGRGIFNTGATATMGTLNSVTISNNGNDGVVNTSGGRITLISNSTISGNAWDGISNIAFIGTLINTTISGNNTSTITSSGITNYVEISNLINNTIAGNLQRGITNLGTIGVARNNLVAGNGAGGTENLIGAALGAFNLTGTFTSVGLDPVLANNGGPTLTHRLLPNSIAIDAGDTSAVPVGVTTDQRGSIFSRTVGVVDMGAFEAQDAPPTGLTLSATSVDENAEVGTLVGTFSTIDADGGTFTYSFATGAGDTDNGSFTINGNQLLIDTMTDFETKSAYSIRVRTTDANNVSLDQVFTITINNRNEGPTAIALTNSNVAENEAGAVVGTVNVTDPDANESFTFSVNDDRFEVVNGQLKLKQGNSLNAETTPSLNLDITVTDSGNLSRTQTFGITVTNVNEAPTVVNPLTNQTSPEDSPVNFTIPTNTFSDVDDTTLSFFATLADDSPLPNWLSLNATTGTFSGTPPLNFNGPLNIKVTARDAGGLSASSNFTLTITAVNDAPVVANALGDRAVAENTPVNFAIPANTFSDVDDATLTLTASLANDAALPSWLSFDAATRTFAGTPPLNFNGTLNLKVTATDAGGLAAASNFALVITAVNQVPTVANPLTNQSTAEDTAINFTIPSNTFSDVEDATLSLTATLADDSALPGWLTFDSGTGTFSGTPPLNFNGSLNVKVTATDAGGLSASSNFTLAITAVNDAPVVANALGDRAVAENTPVNFAIPANTFSDVDDATLSLTASLADDAALPSWLSFDATTRTFAGTPPLNFNGTLNLKVTATDASGLAAASNFALVITAVNQVPTVANPLTNQSTAEDTAINFTIPSNTFSDVEDATLSLTATLADDSALPGWLTFDNGTGTFSGTPPLNFNGSLNVKVTATDAGGLSASSNFTLAITAVNDAPVVANALGDRAVAENTPVNFAIPANTFSDVDDATLSLTASLANDAALPDWLSFDATTRTFAGTPPLNFNGTLNLKVTATDASGLAAASNFALVITAVNQAPTVANPLTNQSIAEDTAINFTIPSNTFSDVEDATLSLTATLADDSALPGWLTFDSGTGTFSGTPPLNFNGSLNVKVTATDAGGLSASSNFTLTITAVNDAPVVANALGDRAVAENTPVNFTIPANTFSDVDDATLSLTASLANDAALPDWLSFDATTGTFSGTPPLNVNGNLELKVTATDAGGLSTSSSFVLAIIPAVINTAPTISAIANQTTSSGGSGEVTTIGPLSFTIADTETPASSLTVTAASSNATLIPDSNIVLGGELGDRTITLVPASNQSGTATITITVSDGTNTTQTQFTVSVSSNDGGGDNEDPGCGWTDDPFDPGDGDIDDDYHGDDDIDDDDIDDDHHDDDIYDDDIYDDDIDDDYHDDDVYDDDIDDDHYDDDHDHSDDDGTDDDDIRGNDDCNDDDDIYVPVNDDSDDDDDHRPIHGSDDDQWDDDTPARHPHGHHHAWGHTFSPAGKDRGTMDVPGNFGGTAIANFNPGGGKSERMNGFASAPNREQGTRPWQSANGHRGKSACAAQVQAYLDGANFDLVDITDWMS